VLVVLRFSFDVADLQVSIFTSLRQETVIRRQIPRGRGSSNVVDDGRTDFRALLILLVCAGRILHPHMQLFDQV
jgi:hypothetical protein